MEPKISLPCSEEAITGLCAEPDESNPYPISVKWILILSSDICSALQTVYLLPSDFPTKWYMLPYITYPANNHKQMTRDSDCHFSEVVGKRVIKLMWH